MESYIQNIELINNYLNKLLSNSENHDFGNRLKTDVQFNALYEEHIVFLEGLKRQSLKVEIKKAKQSYVRSKWFKYIGIFIVILIVSTLVYINLNSNNAKKTNEQPDEITNTEIVLDSVLPENVLQEKIVVEDILQTEKAGVKEKVVINKINSYEEITEVEILEKTSQLFSINSQKDTTIICKEGTKLIIKANSFKNMDNSEVNGKLDLRVTEFYKLSDMLLANLTTTSNGDLLETGGMLFIEAKKDKTFLKLKENSSIEISFPIKEKKDNMQLFSGDWKNGNINWTLEKQDNQLIKYEVVEATSNSLFVQEDIEVPFAIIEQIPVYPGCENLKSASGKRCMNDSIDTFIQRNFNPKIITKLGLTGRQRINAIFKINKDGDIIGIQTRASHPDLEREASRVIALLPKMQPGKQRGKVVTVPYALPIIFQVDGKTGIISNINNGLPIGTTPIQDSIVDKRFEDRLIGKEDVSVYEVNNYILRTSKLGWINCDRFTNRNNKIKYKLKIKNEDGAKVSIVFKSLNSILPSRYLESGYDFGAVPKDEDIVIVAIKMHDDKLYLDIIDTKTEQNPDLEFNFKEVSIQEMKNELRKLNTLF